jgi:hypothetical protein
MKKEFLLLVFFSAAFNINMQAQTNLKAEKYNSISTFTQFESAMPPIRVRGNPILKHGGFPGAGGQMESCILVNPKDSTKLIMFYAGQNLIIADGGRGALAKAWAYRKNPLVWYEYEGNPILTPDPLIPFETFSVRMDCVLYKADTDEYWIYYTGRTDTPQNNKGETDAVGLAICPAGKDGYSDVTMANIKKYAGNPVLSASGQGRKDGDHVSQSSVIIDKGIYYMYYSYRHDSTDILPGIRYATSTDGITWTKADAGNIISRGSAGSPDSKYFEWKQCFKAFNKYILIWEAFNGTQWAICMASADKPEGPWTKSRKNPIFRPSDVKGTFDELFVATPAFYFFDEKWYLYYQGASNGGNYNFNTWDMGAAILQTKNNPEKSK